jgi:hypothetical protein
MSTASAKSNPVSHFPRCGYRDAARRRCRSFAVPNSSSCAHHRRQEQEAAEAAAVAETLTKDLTEFNSAEDVNDFLARLLLLLARDQISPRRAAVLAYVSNLILRSLAAMEAEYRAQTPDWDRPQLIVDIPRPVRDDPPPATGCPVPRA